MIGHSFSPRCHLARKIQILIDSVLVYGRSLFQWTRSFRAEWHHQRSFDASIDEVMEFLLPPFRTSWSPCIFETRARHPSIRSRGDAHHARPIITQFSWRRVGGGSTKTPPPKFVLTDVERSDLSIEHRSSSIEQDRASSHNIYNMVVVSHSYGVFVILILILVLQNIRPPHIIWWKVSNNEWRQCRWRLERT